MYLEIVTASLKFGNTAPYKAVNKNLLAAVFNKIKLEIQNIFILHIFSNWFI